MDLKGYIEEIPKERQARFKKIQSIFKSSVAGVRETMRYRMPTYEKNGNWAAIGNQKNYLSVYFCSEDIIRPIKEKFPKISTGKGCVRFKDKDPIPETELKECFIRAMTMKK